MAKAKMTGADKKNPARFKDRTEPDGGGPIGDAPAHFKAPQRKAWEKFVDELEWLTKADRALLEVTCITRAEIEAGGSNVTASLLREHRQQLSSLGATPTQRSNVVQPRNEDDLDPFKQFM